MPATAYTPKHLRRWTRPEHYIGADWPEWYVSLGRTRDSNALDRSNFDAAWAAIDGAPRTPGVPAPEIVEEGHFLCGWVQWIAVHEDDAAALAVADRLAARLEDYPVLDEERLSEMEYDAAARWWKQESVRGRVEILRRCRARVSAFAARSDELPDDPDGRLVEYMRD